MTITLENTLLRLEVAPEVGGSVVRFEALRKDGAIDLFRPSSPEETDANHMALFPLVPWSNRISGDGFEWQGSIIHWRPIVTISASPFMAMAGSRPGRYVSAPPTN
ncbi:aldose epimerase family protein [Modicisalibacter luteus]|uniref:hypothetical protein n=1 Tax=Modicisalibacter luteus TaxID=453962 RepID=UPI00364006DB